MGKRKPSSSEKKAKQEARRRRDAQRRGKPSREQLALGIGALFQEQGGPLLRPAALHAIIDGLDSDWRRFGASAYTSLWRALRSYEPSSTVALIGGLLTEPEYQAGTLRIEFLQHIAVASCRGDRIASAADLRYWINDVLGNMPLKRMEDPVEDVFVSNVMAPGGNSRVFEGTWELNDASLQPVVEALAWTSWGDHAPPVLPSALALLRLSDAVAGRAGLVRWTVARRTEAEEELLPPDLDVDVLRDRVLFSDSILASLGIRREDLEPFVLQESRTGRIRNESHGHSTLERYPLVASENGLILACPSAVSPAVRRYVLEACEDVGDLAGLSAALLTLHRRDIFKIGLSRIDAASAVGQSALPAQKMMPLVGQSWDEVHCAIDTDKAAIVVLLPDTLSNAARDGFSIPVADAEQNERLSARIEAATKYLGATAKGGGLVILVYAGLGRGCALGIPHLPSHWHSVMMSAGNFGTFARSPDASLLRLWKLEEQRKRLQSAGVEIVDTNGTLNSYAFWVARGYSLCPLDVPYPAASRALVQVAPEFIRDFRVAERRLHDEHAVALEGVAGRIVRVHRRARAAFFPAMQERPLYVSEEAASNGELAGVCLHDQLTVWVLAERPATTGRATEFVYRIWDALLSWLDRLSPEIVSLVGSALSEAAADSDPRRITIALSEETGWQDPSQQHDGSEERPTAVFGSTRADIRAVIPFGFLRLLQQPANQGERVLLEVIAEALLGSLSSPSLAATATATDRMRDSARDLVTRAMRNADARHIHLFDAMTPTDHIAAMRGQMTAAPRFVFEEDKATWCDGLAWRVVDRATVASQSAAREALNEVTKGAREAQSFASSVATLAGRDPCKNVLNGLVLDIWQRVRSELETIDRTSLIHLALENLEAISSDREQWHRTARATLALYAEDDDVARISTQREARRSDASRAGRVLIEMAVCTCPQNNGRKAALTDLDHLTAGVSELIGLAFDSDAIHSEFANPELRLHPNGRIEVDHSFLAEVVGPFSAEVMDADFHRAAEAYSKLYRSRQEDLDGETVESTNRPRGASEEKHPPALDFDPEFVQAFAAEFVLPPNRVLDSLSVLVQFGVESGALVTHTTRGAVAERLKSECDMSDHEVAALFRMLALQPRPRWDATPAGFRKRDWEPWHFRRRLSVVARPLIACGPVADGTTEMMFGMHQLGMSISYLFDNVESAWLPAEFFTSEEMLKYRGRVADVKGAAFTQRVANALRAVGWESTKEVQMTTIGAPGALGDLDVVAWREHDPRIVLVECKRLQPARTPGEIAALLRHFQGQERDRLGRHIARCEWVRDNLDALRRHLAIPETASSPIPLLVTNRLVPMRFREDLPLPAEHIVSFDLLASTLA